MRRPKRSELGWIPPRGVELDPETHEVTFLLSAPQEAVHLAGVENGGDARFRVLIAGRRFGKTHLSCVELITTALEEPGVLCWYVAPTYRMAKDIAWDTLKAMLPPWYRKGQPNESTLTIRLLNGSVISLKGAEHYDRLRGRRLRKVVPDEFADMDARAWTEALRPSLADSGGSALFIGTPKGFNWAYDLHLKGMPGYDGPDAAEWRSFSFTTAQGGRVTLKELAAAKASMDPRVFRQEFNASFETLAGRVYSNFLRAVHVDHDVMDLGGEVLVGVDFNVNPMTAVFANAAGDECHVFDAIELPNSDTAALVRELQHRYPRRGDPRLKDPKTGEMRPPRRVVVCPDPSGKARKTSAQGQTDFTLLEGGGFLVDAPSAAPLVKDRVNNLQALLVDAAGTMRMRIHPRAAPLVKAFDGLTYVKGEPDKKSPLIHITDAAGYLCWQRFNRLLASWATTRVRV
jgi:hypothetical protein